MQQPCNQLPGVGGNNIWNAGPMARPNNSFGEQAAWKSFSSSGGTVARATFRKCGAWALGRRVEMWKVWRLGAE